MTVDLTHEAGHNLKVRYDWLQNDGAKENLLFPEVDTGALKDWLVLKVEGEPDPVIIESID